MSVRLAALIALDAGDIATARDGFADAVVRVTRVSDAYAWVHALVLDSSAALAVRTEAPDAEQIVERLTTLAERCGLREMVVRAHLHRAQLGDAESLEAAHLLAADIDNPALASLLAPLPT
jgi:predicted metal-dependent HD superfamily phosphohydrolase